MLQNKFNIIIDGQFGSTGKGLLAAYLAVQNSSRIYIAASNLSPNAGHTFFHNGKFEVAKQLPVAGIVNKTTIYLTAGSIINIDMLLEEVEHFGIDPNKVFIHPNAAVVEKDDLLYESQKDSGPTKIASTQSGVGKALSRKILREGDTVNSYRRKLKGFNVIPLDLMRVIDNNRCILMETSQGYGLSLDSRFYPHCTSRNITINSILDSAGVHPYYLGNVIMSIRSFPIRVGNIVEDDKIIGYSGDFYIDSEEISWSDIGVEPELTTVTKRERRVATFSFEQYREALHNIRPTHVFLNFYNYFRKCDKETIDRIFEIRRPDLIGLGPKTENIQRI